MKTPTEAFNQSIQSFLEADRNSSASNLILVVQERYSRHGTSYYGMFDALAGEIGLQFIAVLIFDHKKGDYEEYWPLLKY